MQPIIFLIALITLSVVFACNQQSHPNQNKSGSTVVNLFADMETNAVADTGDAADDAAFWICRDDPTRSLIIGTDKQQGLYVYNLEGTLIYTYPVGRINNVDVREGFPLGERRIDLVAGTNRDHNTLLLMMVDPDNGSLSPVLGGPIQSSIQEVYGCCLYHDLQSDRFFAFINGKDGIVEQWELISEQEDKIGGKLIRSFAMESQTEGMVADDETGWLYIGEEDKGIWKFLASADDTTGGILVDTVGGGQLVADVEGLTIYYAEDGNGYLIASSQGDSSFAVYERQGDNRFIGRFRIVDGEVTDGVSDTDGIDVINIPAGPAFPEGIFVAQDGYNRTDTTTEMQNFKIVSWVKIKEALNLK